MQRDRGDIDFRDVVDADRRGGGDGRHVGRIVGEAAAIENMVGGECLHHAGRPIDPDPRVHLEGMPLDPALKLLIAVVGEPDRPARKEHRRERDIERKGRMVAAAEAAAHIGELRVDARRLEGRARLAQHERDRLRDLVRRLHPEHEFEILAAGVVPGDAAFRLEKHRIDGLGLELAIQHQQGRILRGKLGADLLAVGRSLSRKGSPLPAASGDQTGSGVFWICAGLNPTRLDR